MTFDQISNPYSFTSFQNSPLLRRTCFVCRDDHVCNYHRSAAVGTHMHEGWSRDLRWADRRARWYGFSILTISGLTRFKWIFETSTWTSLEWRTRSDMIAAIEYVIHYTSSLRSPALTFTHLPISKSWKILYCLLLSLIWVYLSYEASMRP